MKIETKTVVKIAVAIFALYLAIHYWPGISDFIGDVFGAAVPLIIGCVMAYLLNILMSFYERHFFPASKKKFIIKSRRWICLLLALITLVLVVAIVIALVLPQIVSTAMLVVDEIPDAISDVLAKLDEYDLLSDEIINKIKGIDWESKIAQIFDTVATGITGAFNIIMSMITSLFSIVTTAFLSVIFAIYLLLGKEKIASQIKRIMKRCMKEHVVSKIDYFVSVFNDSFHRFIVGQCTEAVILGVLVTLGMFILNLPYAPMIGATMAFTALIPVVGAFVGGGVGVFLILMQSPIKALVFLIFIIVLQQLENNLVYPRVVGSSIGLPGIWVLASVTVGGGVLGIAGMMLGVPLAASLYRLIREFVSKDSGETSEENNSSSSFSSSETSVSDTPDADLTSELEQIK